MSMFPSTAPTNKKELFERLREILQHGWYTMPQSKRTTGTGGPGNFLEDLFGLRVGNQDIADLIGYEIKYYTDKTSLITLFHREAQPENIMRHMVRKWGWKDSKGRLSFRHTIHGKSDRFKVEDDSAQIIVRPLKGNGPVPYWTHNDLMNIAGSKLRRLLLVKGERKNNTVRFSKAACYEDLNFSQLTYEIARGTICIDFDVREQTAGSGGLRNHGTKFRIKPEDVGKLYEKKQPFRV